MRSCAQCCLVGGHFGRETATDRLSAWQLPLQLPPQRWSCARVQLQRQSNISQLSVECHLIVYQCQHRQPTCAAHDRSAAVHELTLPSMPYVPSPLSHCHDPWHANKKTLEGCYSSCMLHSTAFHSVGQPAPLPGCSVTQRQKVKVLPFLFSSELGSSNRSTHIAGLTQ